jgi:Flp pilus assembly protein TadG
MMITAPFTYALRTATHFLRAERGNVAMIFALAAVPIVIAMGAAIDYTRAVNARSAMQAALDSAALMISQDATTLTQAQLTTKATNYFNALYSHPEVSVTSLTATYTAASTTAAATVVLAASGTLPTDFMALANYSTMTINTNSTATWGVSRLRVALVLDNTYSMNDSGKLSALKTSAKSLIDNLSGLAKTAGDVYISIIPFNIGVNVGTANKTATWLDWTYFDANPCSGGGYTTQSSCTSHSHLWTNNHNSWSGCVRDRTATGNYDTLSTVPNVGVTDTLFQPFTEDFYYSFFGDACPQQLTPLSYDWTTLKSNIDAMVANGTTDQQIGLAWGWLSLLQQSPLSAPAETSGYTYNKIIILLSDGDNTANRTYPWDGTGGYPPQSTIDAIDARQKVLCDNIKAAGITIYTIQVNTDGTANSTVMSYCASDSAKYFSTTTSSGISTAFSSISTSLSKLRIAR